MNFSKQPSLTKKIRLQRLFFSMALLSSMPNHAWEIANTNTSTTINAIGQSISPTVIDNAPELVAPRGVGGKALMNSFSFAVAGTSTLPDNIYVYAQPPEISAGIIDGQGAIAVGTRLGNGYVFDPPAELPLNALSYVLFPFCLEVNAGLLSYPGGNNLAPQTGCPPGTEAVVDGVFDIEFSATFLNPVAPLLADYRFDNGELESFKPGVGDLELIPGSEVALDNIDGVVRNVLSIPENSGAQLILDDALSQDELTVVTLVKVEDVNADVKIIDLTNLSEESGVYLMNQLVNHNDDPSPSTSPVIAPNTYFQVGYLQRPPSSFSDRFTQGFVGDVRAFQFNNSNPAALSPTEVVTLMNAENANSPVGSVARLRIYDGTLPPGETGALSILPTDGADLYENDDTPLQADLGLLGPQGVASFRNFHSDSDVDWSFVSDRCNNANYYATSDGLYLYSDDPRFQPIVDIYGEGLLTNPSQPPVRTMGGCGQRRLRINPGEGHFSIRNCPSQTVSDEPIHYEVIRLRLDQEVCPLFTRVRGAVIDADTGLPVGGQYIVANDSTTAVSALSTGDYTFATIAGGMTMNIVSTEWQGDPVMLATEPGESYNDVDIFVTRIAPPNDVPVAVADAVSVPEDTPLNADLATNDTLSNDGDNTFSLVSEPTRGTATVSAIGILDYSPAANTHGADSLSYQIADGNGDISVAQVSITVTPVNDPPIAAADTATVNADSMDQIIDVLANDSDIDSPMLSISAVTQPAGGGVVVAGNSLSISYTPTPGLCNNGAPPDSFTYLVTDGIDSAQGDVAVTVICTSDFVFSDGFE